MVKLVVGRYGPKLLGPGTILNLDVDTERRLVKKNIAIYVDCVDNYGNTEDKIEKKSVDELKKIRSKKDLIKYAESIGLHDLKEADSKDALFSAIANYQEENLEEE